MIIIFSWNRLSFNLSELEYPAHVIASSSGEENNIQFVFIAF